MSIFTEILSEITGEELIFDKLSFEISNQFLAYMASKNITQKNLAEKIGCSEAYISKQLSGDSNLTLKTIAKFADALNLKIDVSVYDNTLLELVKKMNTDNWREVNLQIQNNSDQYESVYAA